MSVPISRVEVILQQTVMSRGSDDEQVQTPWSVDYFASPDEPALVFVGALSGIVDGVMGHALVSSWVVWEGGVPSSDELPDLARVVYAAIKEPLYDLARRTLQAQAAVFDVSFGFPVKSPEVELGLGDGPNL